MAANTNINHQIYGLLAAGRDNLRRHQPQIENPVDMRTIYLFCSTGSRALVTLAALHHAGCAPDREWLVATLAAGLPSSSFLLVCREPVGLGYRRDGKFFVCDVDWGDPLRIANCWPAPIKAFDGSVWELIIPCALTARPRP